MAHLEERIKVLLTSLVLTTLPGADQKPGEEDTASLFPRIPIANL